MVVSVGDGMWWTDFHAGRAEYAASEIERNGCSWGAGDGFGRANRHARTATRGAHGCVDLECAAVTVWQWWRRAFRIGHRLTAALEAVEDGVVNKHGDVTLEVVAAVGQVEALVADREIRDGGAAQRECKATPIVE